MTSPDNDHQDAGATQSVDTGQQGSEDAAQDWGSGSFHTGGAPEPENKRITRDQTHGR